MRLLTYRYIFNRLIDIFQRLELQRATLNTRPSFQRFLFVLRVRSYGILPIYHLKEKPQSFLTFLSRSSLTHRNNVCTIYRIFSVPGRTTATSVHQWSFWYWICFTHSLTLKYKIQKDNIDEWHALCNEQYLMNSGWWRGTVTDCRMHAPAEGGKKVLPHSSWLLPGRNREAYFLSKAVNRDF